MAACKIDQADLFSRTESSSPKNEPYVLPLLLYVVLLFCVCFVCVFFKTFPTSHLTLKLVSVSMISINIFHEIRDFPHYWQPCILKQCIVLYCTLTLKLEKDAVQIFFSLTVLRLVSIFQHTRSSGVRAFQT